MKHSKLLLLLAGITAVSGLAACGETSSEAPATSETPATSQTPATSEESKNTFGEGITEEEKAILAKISEGDFTKPAFEATDVLVSKYEVKVGGELKEIIYKGHATTSFIQDGFDVYVGVSVETLKITGVQTVGKSTTHTNGSEFKDTDLGMTGTDGSTFDTVTGSTVTSEAINKVAKAVVAAVKAEVEEPEVPDVPEKESFTVSFDLNGGVGVVAPVKVEAGKLVTRPANDPVKADYNFIGWFIKGTDTKYDFTAPVTADLFLEARYQTAYTFYKGEILKAPKVGANGVVEIPASIDGETVTTLTDHLFAGNTDLKEIIIPETVKEIKFNAFEGCTSLTKFSVRSTLDEDGKIAKDLEFGIHVFDGCTALTEFNVPARATTLGTASFANCTGLKKVNFTTVIDLSNDLFAGCTSLQEVNLAKVENEYCDLGQRAFEGCTSLATINNSETIENLNTDALNGCTSLKKIAFGKAFRFNVNGLNGTKLEEITIDPENTRYSCVNKIFYEVSGGKPTTLKYCYDPEITTLEIPATVTLIDGKALQPLEKLASITVAEGNTVYSARDNLLFKVSGSSKNLDFVPAAFKGAIKLTGNEKFKTYVKLGAGVTTLETSPEDTYYVKENGCLFNSSKSTLYFVDRTFTGDVVLPVSCKTINDYALAYSQANALVITYVRNMSWDSLVSCRSTSFEGVGENLKIYFPAKDLASYKQNANWKSVLSHIQDTEYVAPEVTEPQA